jgi:hypothetical protein
MVSRCAMCGVPFLYLHSGKVFGFDNERKEPVYWWLCKECSRHWTIEFTSQGEARVVPKDSAFVA